MRRELLTMLVLIATAIVNPSLAKTERLPGESPVMHHQIRVFLDPEGHRFAAEDTITLPEGSQRALHFVLHRGLNPVSLTPNVTVTQESTSDPKGLVESFRVACPRGTRTFSLKYGGKIYHPVSPSGEEVPGGMRQTPGIISKQGVFLSGASHWYPQFDDRLISFTVEANLSQGWDAVSQGERTLHVVQDGSRRVTWHCEQPQEEIFLVAGRFFEFSRAAGNIESMVFLRQQDQRLADTYLNATAQYLDMYEKLIGPYPYNKFALVENFWETGYGMPSFTLMGPKVIRFPFIVYSSYPHEILHNWWGNGVFVDPSSGNWSEGLTAYLADHLLQEQRGTAVRYRRNTLQKYTDYVSTEKDFRLAEFRSRHSSVTQAVGYGKCLMFFHMLRTELGDAAFVNGLREFYRQNRFAFASFDTIRKSFETVSGKDLGRMFTQWVDRAGAPQLKISNAKVKAEGDGYRVTVLLEQVQADESYVLHIPVAITMEGQDAAYRTTVRMTEKRQEFEFRLAHAPLRIDVDPEFDVFRRLLPGETPPALTQVFGAKKLIIVIPSRSDEALTKAFQEFARSMSKSGPDEITVMTDSAVQLLPSETSVVILGRKNRLVREIRSELSKHGVKVEQSGLTIGETSVPEAGHTVVITVRHPRNSGLVVTWIAGHLEAAIPRLARKLPHYHNYSYLVFQGDRAANVVKASWPVSDSPLSIFVPGVDGSLRRVQMGTLRSRRPLARLP